MTPRGTIPGPPQNVSLIANDRTLTLSWDEPTNHRDIVGISYEVEYRRDGGNWTSWTSSTTSTAVTRTGTRGSTYQARVLAKTGSTTKSRWVLAEPVTVPALDPPSAPLNVNLEPDGGDLVATWDEPADIDAVPVTGYTVRFRGTGIDDKWRTEDVPAGTLRFRIPTSYGLERGGTYRVQVRATGPGGPGPWSPEAQITMPTGGPRPVITAEITPPANRAFTITITFPERVNGFTITDLVINGGTASEFANNNPEFTALITPTVSGRLTVDIPAGAAMTANGYETDAANRFSIEVDISPPTGVITTASPGPFKSPFTIRLGFSEAIQNLTIDDIEVTLGTVADLEATSGAATEYTARRPARTTPRSRAR